MGHRACLRLRLSAHLHGHLMKFETVLSTGSMVPETKIAQGSRNVALLTSSNLATLNLSTNNCSSKSIQLSSM